MRLLVVEDDRDLNRQIVAALEQAVYWRRNKTKLVKDNRLGSPTRLTVRDAGEQLLSGMQIPTHY